MHPTPARLRTLSLASNSSSLSDLSLDIDQLLDSYRDDDRETAGTPPPPQIKNLDPSLLARRNRFRNRVDEMLSEQPRTELRIATGRTGHEARKDKDRAFASPESSRPAIEPPGWEPRRVDSFRRDEGDDTKSLITRFNRDLAPEPSARDIPYVNSNVLARLHSSSNYDTSPPPISPHRLKATREERGAYLRATRQAPGFSSTLPTFRKSKANRENRVTQWPHFPLPEQNSESADLDPGPGERTSWYSDDEVQVQSSLIPREQPLHIRRAFSGREARDSGPDSSNWGKQETADKINMYQLTAKDEERRWLDSDNHREANASSAYSSGPTPAINSLADAVRYERQRMAAEEENEGETQQRMASERLEQLRREEEETENAVAKQIVLDTFAMWSSEVDEQTQRRVSQGRRMPSGFFGLDDTDAERQAHFEVAWDRLHGTTVKHASRSSQMSLLGLSPPVPVGRKGSIRRKLFGGRR